MKINKIALLILSSGLILSACKKDNNDVKNPSNTNEEELITTLKFSFIDTDSPYNQTVFQYRDVDGLGGNVPSIDTIKLDTGKTYFVSLLLLDESKNPIDTISNEILEESKDHLFIYEIPSNIAITINDYDNNNPPLPLGLRTSWAVLNSGSGNFKLTLKHQPGIKNGDPTRGETDVEVVMPFVVR